MMIDLIGVIDETDYIRYSQKFLKERKQIEENIESLWGENWSKYLKDLEEG